MSEYTVAFNQWWRHYPQYKRKGKGAAFKNWQRDRLDKKVDLLIEILDNQVAHDEHFKKYTPMPSTYLNQRRYDDDVPAPRHEQVPQMEPELPSETDPYVKSVKRVAANWLMRRMRPIADDKVDKALALIHALAQDARELHERGELTDAYAQTIRDELDDMVTR